ncbi:hypothetical protein BANRA_01891 [Klebsiella pneumoniae]|nr:hypothetical protein BANRA_01891 [Klebsiella pneumoniae]
MIDVNLYNESVTQLGVLLDAKKLLIERIMEHLLHTIFWRLDIQVEYHMNIISIQMIKFLHLSVRI